MNSSRRTGLRLAVVATGLWLLVGAAYMTTGPGDGVPIGAGLLYILAVLLSVTASTALLASLRDTTPHATTPHATSPSGTGTTPIRWAAAGLAALSAVLLLVVFVLGPMDVLSRGTMTALLLSGIGTFVASSTLFAVSPDSSS